MKSCLPIKWPRYHRRKTPDANAKNTQMPMQILIYTNKSHHNHDVIILSTMSITSDINRSGYHPGVL
ncbi:hypothetical protein P170DRAFT_124144 [Aspergillus steynii IBT 23096]|uniref:Uncharacterized protein n=1 Tax=Aspergillus steynii IBT 23096 TaxID=1392250 RepID=A0A2I2GJU2_9EURO|nr:uncharacterized protein P170DRAFT_124144 [Aspergillus steynii IBT 23096]PLB53140.1 hypothetical protein P170DRAFT_124144 [Aspergillus steynii IBT 23096]